MKKCDYCGKEISYSEQYCSIECEEQALKLYRAEARLKNVFGIINSMCIIGIVLGCFAGLIISPAIGGAVVSACLLILGVLIIAVPLAPLDLIKKLKLKKAVQITRIIGALLILIGLAVLVIYAV